MDARITKLLTWYKTQKRDLPWRKTRNAYRIFISELMLQQTQVDRVIPKYRAWLKQFPSWKSLANAKTADLIHAWAGLGYNRRALYAREAAMSVVANGEPTDEADWRTLKGVGPYMAAALTEFANHKRAIVLDTNVRRVAGRLILGLPYPRPTDDAKILRALDAATPKTGAHWDVPQAFMDLATAICAPRVPKCAVCPLKNTCRAQQLFSTEKLDATLAKKRTMKPVESRHGEKKHPDRIYRGRILGWIRKNGATRIDALGPKIDETYDAVGDLDWLRGMVARLAKDGLLRIGRGDILSLPNS